MVRSLLYLLFILIGSPVLIAIISIVSHLFGLPLSEESGYIRIIFFCYGYTSGVVLGHILFAQQDGNYD